VYHGHGGLRSFFRRYHEAWEDIEYEAAELIDAGAEHVISVDTQRTRGRTSGVETELTQYAAWTVQDGKIVRVMWFQTRAEALEPPGSRIRPGDRSGAVSIARWHGFLAPLDPNPEPTSTSPC
jgi:hypothetical protein